MPPFQGSTIKARGVFAHPQGVALGCDRPRRWRSRTLMSRAKTSVLWRNGLRSQHRKCYRHEWYSVKPIFRSHCRQDLSTKGAAYRSPGPASLSERRPGLLHQQSGKQTHRFLHTPRPPAALSTLLRCSQRPQAPKINDEYPLTSAIHHRHAFARIAQEVHYASIFVTSSPATPVSLISRP